MLRWKRLPSGEGLPLPARAHAGDAGFDLRTTRGGSIFPGTWDMLSTGYSVEIPRGFVGMVCPRSGLARDYGVTVLNAPGIIDAGYVGEVKVLLIKHGRGVWVYDAGDRIAQLVVVPIAMMDSVEAETISETERGTGGFGSTGR